MRVRRSWGPWAFLVLLGCGDPLIGPGYSGTPAFTVGGTVLQGNLRVPASHGALELGVFWIAQPAQVEQQARLEAGLAEYHLTLFEPPPPSAFGFDSLAPAETLAIAVMVLYAEVDGRPGLTSDGDLVLGASAQHLLVYADPGLTPGPTLAAALPGLTPGYQLYAQSETSTCTFDRATTCTAAGPPVRVDTLDQVPLTLWPTPAEVRVPSPALGDRPLWATP